MLEARGSRLFVKDERENKRSAKDWNIKDGRTTAALPGIHVFAQSSITIDYI